MTPEQDDALADTLTQAVADTPDLTFAHVQQALRTIAGHLPVQDRLAAAYRLCYRGFCGPDRGFWERFEVEVVGVFRESLAARGLLEDAPA